MTDIKNLGYGIAGKKNSYSSKILLDNWVEDTFGAELYALSNTSKAQEAQKRLTQQHYTTTQGAAHIDPALMNHHPNVLKVTLEAPEDVMKRNKEGMPYDLLFSYSSAKDPERFKSTFQSNQMHSGEGNYEQYAKLDGTAMGEREKQVRREIKELQNIQSESRKATRRYDAGSGLLQRAYSGGEESLPRFNKKSPINEYYTAANIPIVSNLRKL